MSEADRSLKIAILVACFNRRQTTLANLGLLFRALNHAGAEFDTFLLDDASPDKTGDAIREAFPKVRVIDGSGQLYWNRGMCAAYAEAVRHGPFAAYLLFNDDVAADERAVAEFLDHWQRCNRERPTTLVGATTDHAKQRVTYSGFRRTSAYHPYRIALIPPGNELVDCDTFNGNFVLIPSATMERLKGLDPHYWHGLGDLDLGYRIAALAQRRAIAPTPIGCCEVGLASSWQTMSPLKRLKLLLFGPDGLRPGAYFIRQHSSNRWAAEFLVIARAAKLCWTALLGLPIRGDHEDTAQLPAEPGP